MLKPSDQPVRSVGVVASTLLAGIAGALVDVDLAVRAVEALVAVATEGVLQRDAVTVVARVPGTVVDLGTVATCNGVRYLGISML